MKIQFVVTAILVAASTALAAPGVMRLGEHKLAPASCGVRHTLWIEHYAVVLYLPGRASAADELIDPANSKALRMQIIDKRLMPSEIPPKWREPMERHLDGGMMARARSAYRTLRPGDSLTLGYVPGLGVLLQVNGRLMAKAPGHGLIDAILDTWADGEPLREKLRGAIARNPCRGDTLADSSDGVRDGRFMRAVAPREPDHPSSAVRRQSGP